MLSDLRSDLGSDWIWPHDQCNPTSANDIRKFGDIFRFEAPRYSYLVQRAAYYANWLYHFRLGGSGHGAVIPNLPESELATLKALPEGAGNLLVGPHPGPVDPQLIFHLLAKAHVGPAVFLMAAESYYDSGQLRRTLFNRLGVIPVARGRRNPDAIRCMTEYLAKGWWGGVFPEGEVYFCRDVMPMEYGAVRIAVEAALRVQSDPVEDTRPRAECRPVYITPFAHVYFFINPIRSKQRAEEALREIEAHPMISITAPTGGIPTRLRQAADRLLRNKADDYGIPPDDWSCDDRFERVQRLQDAVLTRIEQHYLGHPSTSYARRRAMEVRMACFERLAHVELSEEERRHIEKDVQKTRELILMTPFTRAYRQKHGDLEMWIEYLRRFRSALNLRPFDFGPQNVTFRMLQPIDMHPIAVEYSSLANEQHRKDLLYGITESIRDKIQASVDDICSSRPALRIPDPLDQAEFRV